MAPVLPTINIGPQTPVDMGNVFNPVGISTEQYLSGPVNFYGQALDTSIGTDTDDSTDDSTDDTTDNTSGPNIYADEKGTGDNEETSFNELNKAFKNTELLGVSDINLNSDMFKSADLTQSRFSDVVKGGFALGKRGATPAFGKGVSAGRLPSSLEVGLGMAGLGVFSGMAAVFGGMNQAQMGRLAAEINANGGAAGAMMKLGNISIGRFPGQMMYVGTTHGYSDAQLAGMEAMKRGFVPGTLVAEVQNPDGTWTKTSGKDALVDKETMAKSGGTYDPTTGSFKYPGGSAASGTLEAATLHAANFSKQLSSTYGSFAKVSAADIVTARTLTKTNMFGTVEGKTFKDNLTSLALDNMAKNAYGVDTFANLEENIGGSFSDAVKAGVSGYTDFSGVASGKPGMDYSTVNTYDDDDDPDGSSNDGPSDSSSGSSSDSTSNSGPSSDQQADEDAGVDWASGGRIGMQEGGPAGFAQRPEFVGGNQTQPDGVSVADDQPRDVQEGTFVINAAAADFAGRSDIEKMIRDAYKKVGDTGQSGVSQEVAINVSKGEVMIPPHIAKVIGYDRLNKINNRGKKEIARRQEAAGGGFIDRKKFAKGGMPLPKSKPKRVKHSGLADVELRADLEEYIQNDPLARLGFNLYEKGDVDVKAIVLPARKPVEVAIAGVYTPKNERRDPGSVTRKFEGFANKQGITKQNRDVAAIHYLEGDNVNYGRAEGPLTLLHELRHHAMRHLNQKYKVPLPELSREESMFDAQDYVNRLQARKVKPSIREKPKEKNLEIRQKGMYMSPSANKELAMFQEIAEEVLKDRKVPPRTKSKEVEGFFTRAMRLLGL